MTAGHLSSENGARGRRASPSKASRGTTSAGVVVMALAAALSGGQELPSGAAAPQTSWSGTSVGAIDGDTVLVLRNGRRVTVELASADAPEAKQDNGLTSMATLASLIDRQTLTVTVLAEIASDHVLASVKVGDRDLALQMVSAGHAWAARIPPPDDQFAVAENEARTKRLGLWSSRDPIPPWQYRANQKEPEIFRDNPPEQLWKSSGLSTVAGSVRLTSEDGGEVVIDSSDAPPSEVSPGTDNGDPLGVLRVHLISYRVRVTGVVGQRKGGGRIVRVSWEVRLRNSALEERTAEVDFLFYDRSHLLLHRTTKSFVVPADTEKTFEGYHEVSSGTADNTQRIDVELVP